MRLVRRGFVVGVVACALAVEPVSAQALSPVGYRFHPSFPVFDGGRFSNLLDNDKTMANGLAHAGFSLAIPLLGEHFWGRKGLWAAGLGWLATSMTLQGFFSRPANPPPYYSADYRTDLMVKVLPCATILAWDLVRPRRHDVIKEWDEAEARRLQERIDRLEVELWEAKARAAAAPPAGTSPALTSAPAAAERPVIADSLTLSGLVMSEVPRGAAGER